MHSVVKFSLYLSLSHSVTLYFKCNSHLSMYSLSSSPHRRFVVQTKISCKYILLFSLHHNSFSYSTPCHKDQLTVYHLLPVPLPKQTQHLPGWQWLLLIPRYLFQLPPQLRGLLLSLPIFITQGLFTLLHKTPCSSKKSSSTRDPTNFEQGKLWQR